MSDLDTVERKALELLEELWRLIRDFEAQLGEANRDE